MIEITTHKGINISFNRYNGKFEFEIIKGKKERYASLLQSINKIDNVFREVKNVEPVMASLKRDSYLRDDAKIRIIGIDLNGNIKYLNSKNKISECEAFHAKQYTIDNGQNIEVERELVEHNAKFEAFRKESFKKSKEILSRFKYIEIKDYNFKIKKNDRT